MPMPTPLFSPWVYFYSITGSAAGALTGLQFISITLIAQSRGGGTMREVHAFGSPTVVHFCTALLLSALTVMPWPSPLPCGICFSILGLLGTLYCIRVVWHARRSSYEPDREDWLWYTAFPALAHLSLLLSVFINRSNLTAWLFLTAATTLAFLLIGIRNSWDTVTYLAVEYKNHDSSQ